MGTRNSTAEAGEVSSHSLNEVVPPSAGEHTLALNILHEGLINGAQSDLLNLN